LAFRFVHVRDFNHQKPSNVSLRDRINFRVSIFMIRDVFVISAQNVGGCGDKCTKEIQKQ
jgi:hypothetical protein